MVAGVGPVPSPSLHPARLVDTTRGGAGAVGGVHATIEAKAVRYMPRLLQANAGPVVRNVVVPHETPMKAKVVSNSVAMAATKNVAIVRKSQWLEPLVMVNTP
jgi:hypothetical protein